MACENNWVIATSDISGAFLHAPLTEEVHVTPPPEIYTSEAQPGVVWKLKHALYGLRQAPKAWQQHLTQVLSFMGLIQLKSDSCMFKNQSSNMFIIFEISMLESFFKSLYSIYQLERANPVSTPGVKGSPLPDQGSELLHFTDHKKYRMSIGKLLWLSAIRPDIEHAIKELSRKLSAPSINDEKAVKDLIRYLRGTQDQVMRFAPNNESKNKSDIEIHAYSDSDWAGCAVTRNSTTGVLLQIHDHRSIIGRS
eukprot:499008-Amphidinium_carterae.3